MEDQYVVCPGCGRQILVTEAFSRQIEGRLRGEFNADARKKENEHKAALAAVEKEFGAKLVQERSRLEARALKQAQDGVALEVQDLTQQLEDKSKKLDDAMKQELVLRKRQQEVEERERNLKLEVQRTLDGERRRIQDDATARALKEHQLKDREKDMQLTAMREQIEDLKRKAEQGSQQAQGEALEVELEDLLRAQFRGDAIEPVAKGTRGADALQRVCDPGGKFAGVILWESKRTKAWNDAWIQKLKDDQRDVKADLAVIVSTVLSKEIQRIGHIDGVWVTDFSSVIGLATALRASVIQVAQARSALVGKNEKMELLYNYLSGPEFRQRVEAIVESFTFMKEDLEAERRAMERQWAKREKQITRVIQSTSGMYGDLQGIIGASLGNIPVLELPLRNATGEDEEEIPF